jgi:hypothetical protein
MSSLRVTSLKGGSVGQSPTLPDGVVVTGVATATSFSGDLTGNATGLSGTPDVTVNNVVAGIITATSFTGVPAGFTELDAALFN